MTPRRSQADRRAETKAAVLSSAIKLFGDKGFAATSLEDIGNDCGVSIAPIYHYFGNKKKLFLAVNEAMEEQIVSDSDSEDIVDKIQAGWKTFSELCLDPGFRKIVLVDGPNVLGRERMYESKVTEWTLNRMRQRFNKNGQEDYKAELLGRMIMGALAEAGLFIGHAEDPGQASNDAAELINDLVTLLQSSTE